MPLAVLPSHMLIKVMKTLYMPVPGRLSLRQSVLVTTTVTGTTSSTVTGPWYLSESVSVVGGLLAFILEASAASDYQ